MEQFSAIAAWISYCIFFIAPLMQAVRILKRKSSEDVSLSFLGLLMFAFIILVPRMLSTNDPSLYIGHIITLLANTVTFAIAYYYRKRRPTV
jgi:uncharacterized protein with PQ loop repeat